MSDAEIELKGRLRSYDAEIRRRAVLELGAVGVDTATPLLLEALGDEDWRVRKEAAALSARFADHRPLVEGLIRATFEEDNIGLKNAAQEALSRAGEKVEEDVAKVLSASDPESRKVAVDIIGALRSNRAVELLSSALDDENINVQVAAAERLGEQCDKGAETALLRCLNAAHPLLRITALQSLRHLGAAVPFSTLASLLDEPVLRDEVLLALGRCGAQEAVPELMRHLDHETSACVALESLHDHGPALARAVEAAMTSRTPEIRTALLEMTRSDDPDVARAAVRCMLWAADTRDIPEIVTLARNSPLYTLLIEGLSAWGEKTSAALLPMLSQETEHRLASVIGLVTRLLDDDTGRKTATLFASHLSSAHPAVTTAAAGAVARFGDERVVPDLVQLLKFDDSRIRGAAGLALVEIARRRPREVRRTVAAVSLEGEAGVELCRVLEIAGTEADLERLARAADSSDPMLRRAALKAYASVGKEKALPRISALLRDENLGFRIAAADALALVGTAAQDVIVRALDTAEGPAAAGLLRSLGKVGHPDAEATLVKMCRKSPDLILPALDASTALGVPLTGARSELLRHRDEEVVKAALNAFGDNIPLQELTLLLSHESWDIRLRVVHALGRRREEAGVEGALKERLQSEDNDLVQEAVKAVLAADQRDAT